MGITQTERGQKEQILAEIAGAATLEEKLAAVQRHAEVLGRLMACSCCFSDEGAAELAVDIAKVMAGSR